VENETGAFQNHCKTTVMAVRFWTDQLKRAILTRYGKVGGNIDIVRQLLQHTKSVMRHANGLDRVEHKFI
jgi:hypothetical protein